MADTALDPTITPELLEQAHDEPAIDYDQVFAEITARLAQDDVDDTEDQARGFLAAPIRKPGQACLEARRIHEENVDVGIGYCLRTVRGYFDVAALWPDAETAGEHSAPLHRTTDPNEFPCGSVGYAYNGRHGHVWLNVGGGMCWTTDYRRLGRVDLAPVSAMAPWIGGRLIGWGEVLNGVDVWPDPKKPEPKPWTLQDRRDFVHRRLLAAREHDHKQLAHQLKMWQDRMDDRLAKR
jgi:hypothetical protein